ncbi:MAG: hypothetical protein HF977_08260 [ANME-2 cluster archaeon]|nr:hypothetical protein [ANME-2 cluster archaeon]MBC2763024.1 hypothetical protein [ANME-2 cluster archaeon]
MLPKMCAQSPNNANIHHAITLWDRGGLVVKELRENEKILFELSGNKMQGRYALIKTGFGGQNKNWLFFKRK